MSPAPWRYNRETGDILAADGHYIGQACVDADAPCPEWDAAEIANAQLIEAAPDLLAACEDCLLIGTSPMGTLYDLRRALSWVRAAVAKARGTVARDMEVSNGSVTDDPGRAGAPRAGWDGESDA